MDNTLTESYGIPKVVFRLMAALMASILIGMAAPLAVYVPFTPVPFTLQLQLVFLFAALLGPNYAMVVVLSFLSQGFIGLPVFAGGKIGAVLSPSFGYLLGYLFAARFLGYAFQSGVQNSLKSFFYFSMANLIVYAFGVSYLQLFVGPTSAILYGFLPFVIPDILKNILLAKVVSPARRTYDMAL